MGRGVSWAYLLFRHSVLIHLEMVLASAVRPAMETPTWSSMGRIFFWWLDSSLEALFRATSTAWVLDLRPTVAEPCLTASMAYSTLGDGRRYIQQSLKMCSIYLMKTTLWAPDGHITVVLVAEHCKVVWKWMRWSKYWSGLRYLMKFCIWRGLEFR